MNDKHPSSYITHHSLMWTPIKKILPYLINRLGLKREIEINKIFSLWPDLVVKICGQNYKEKLKPLYFKNRTLFISCPDSIWANELQLRQEELLRKINQHFNQKKIEKLKFVY